MRATIFAVLGALAFAALAFVIGAAISQYQVRVLHYSPARADAFIDAFLLSWPLITIVGAYLGYRVHRRCTGRRNG